LRIQIGMFILFGAFLLFLQSIALLLLFLS
jgi:hypothetical protein